MRTPRSPEELRARREEAERRRAAAARRGAWIAGAVLALALVAVATLRGCGGEGNPTGAAEEGQASGPAAELPGGGLRILPDRRVVAYYGAPQDPELGALGTGPPSEVVAKLKRQAKPYETRKRPVLLALELIAAVAASDPGDDGEYILRQPPEVIDRYLELARRSDAVLILDVQPGRADFPGEVRRLRPWLREPDVSLALDPEWHVGEGEVPGQVVGSVDAGTVNAVARRLQRTIERHDLPQKLLIVHQFTADMIARRNLLKPQPDVALTLNVDGFGGAEIKAAKYSELHAKPASGLYNGFKLFYSEDDGLMRPKRVLRLKPEPDVVVYE